MKNSKGITLVALVVTIIVLLILAGVSLSLVAGGNGIITRASTASDTNYDASAQEQAELAMITEITNWYEDKYVNKNTSAAASQLAHLESKYSEATDVNGYGTLQVASGKATLVVTRTGHTFEADIDSNGKVGTWEKQ